MIAWMIYSALVALIVAGAARAADCFARLAGYSVRMIWMGALVLTTVLSASSALRGITSGTPVAKSLTIGVSENISRSAEHQWLRALEARIERIRSWLDTPLQRTIATVRREFSPAADVYAATFSLVVGLGLVVVLVSVGRRFRKAQRSWPLASVHGVDVRVAPYVGPFVIGVVRPEIVVPRWLLARQSDDQRLVVMHEQEHVRARDPLLLGFAWSAVIVAPWSPCVWYMLSRLRLAVELDCDARVLRRGVAPWSYGSLLIDLAQHASPFHLSAVALTDDSSHLHQRIRAMKRDIPRFARLRGGLAAGFALSGVLLASQATLSAGTLRKPIAAHRQTRPAAPLPIVFIDGIRATMDQMKSLDRKQINTVEVIKGPAAISVYGAEAKDGVIVVTTKRDGVG
jgi:bla regulator protein BlaR1